MVMVLNATFNSTSVISWRSVLLVSNIDGSWEDDRSDCYPEKNIVNL